MLIGLNFDSSVDRAEKEEVGTALAKMSNRRFRVVEPTTIDEYIALLKGYKPGKVSLVLINTHYSWTNQIPEGAWRAFDLEFNRRGGTIYGEEPTRSQTTYQRPLIEEDYQHILDESLFYDQRAQPFIKDALSGYFGRTDSDPHTLLLGFTPRWNKLATSAELLMHGLPEGSGDPWWHGVGFYSRPRTMADNQEEAYAAILERFPYSSRVVLTDVAQDVLDSMGEPYARAEHPTKKSLDEAEKYGRSLRMLSRLDSERVVV